MVVNQKPTGRALSMPAGLAWGAAAGLGVTLLIAALLAKLIEAETLAEENIGYGIMLLLLLSSFCGAIISCIRIKRQRVVVCFLSGLIYFGVLLSITALFFGGQYDAVGVTAVLIFGGCAAAALLGLKENRGGKRKKVRLAHR